MHTLCNTNHSCVIAPVIARQFGNSVGHRADEPGATVTAGGGGKSQLVSATLIQMGYGERKGQAPRILQIGKPLGTVTAGGNKFAVVAANLVKHFGGNYTGAGWHWTNQFTRSPPLTTTLDHIQHRQNAWHEYRAANRYTVADCDGGWPALW
jgi:hypothetical protein